MVGALFRSKRQHFVRSGRQEGVKNPLHDTIQSTGEFLA